MRAAVADEFGPPDVIVVREVEPPAPRSSQVLVRVHASSINPVDWKIRSGSVRWMIPVRPPLILGFDAAGVVEQVGANVERFRPGDRVWARSNAFAGHCHAELVVLDDDAVGRAPKGCSEAEAGTMPLAALTALQGLCDHGKLRPGHDVLVIGASGGVGMFGVQIARALGARVTAVCSEANAAFASSLGADEVIDYRVADALAVVDRYDLIFDAVASRSYGEARRALRTHGRYVTTLPSAGTAVGYVLGPLAQRRARFVVARSRTADLDQLAGLIDSGQLRTTIAAAYSLDELPAAYRLSETGRVVGKIAIAVR